MGCLVLFNRLKNQPSQSTKTLDQIVHRMNFQGVDCFVLAQAQKSSKPTENHIMDIVLSILPF